MKNLELMCVQEMDAVEMRNVDGGNPLVVAALVALAFAICTDIAMNPSAHIEAGKAGWEAAGN